MSSSSPLPEMPALGFLANVSEEHRQFLASFGKFLRPTAGEVIIEEGKPQNSLHLVLSGTLHVTEMSDGRPLLLARIGEGDSLGEINLFDPAVASATVVAKDNCLIWSITRDELNGLIEADAEAGLSVMKGLMAQLSQRIRQMNIKLAESEKKSSFHGLWSAEVK